MPSFKTLGDRCKFAEKNFGNLPYLLNGTPALCRIDGKAFHTFCKGLLRPFDENLSQLMIETNKFLVDQTNAVWGYTQSDEISLCWYTDKEESQMYFDGRRQKIESITAALASVYFNKSLEKYIPEKSYLMPVFDSRAWSVSNKIEASKYFLWRQLDASKNSVSMASQSVYSHTELHGKNTNDKHELLYRKGINWNDYPNFFKRGTFIRRVKKLIPFSEEEIDNLPAQHLARQNRDLTIEINVLELVDMPPFTKVTNKVGVLFNGETPQVLK
jgi:tRNA(His) guanylyltransferase